MNKIYLILLLLGLNITVSAQQQPLSSPQAPKLIVVLVVDQMRYDFLYRFQNNYGTKGLNKLMNEGVNCTNTHYNYAPTYTGPGHCAILSGATPMFSGIAGNNWWDRDLQKEVYCTYDSTQTSVGTTSTAGKMSPHRMQCTNLGDQMKIASCQQAKVFGIALKDRGAILTAGHNPDGAYWFDGLTGRWITSSYYRADLPKWLIEYNAKNNPANYLESAWKPTLPLSGFHTCVSDAASYEGKFISDTTSAFPHYFDASKKISYDVIRATPFGNTITKEIAIELIKNEQLGKDLITDLLTISFSSPDYIGHKFGPQSHEIEDNYVRFDAEIAELLAFLNNEIGKKNVLVVLTADHGAAEVPGYMNTLGMPGGVVNSELEIVAPSKKWLQQNYNDSTLYLYYNNQQIYLDRKKIVAAKLDYKSICEGLASFLLTQKNIYNVLPMQQLLSLSTDVKFYTNWQRGIHPVRSGDLMVLLPLGWLEDMPQGTSHGTSFAYDTHVPLLWWGWHLTPISIQRTINITDIAATISQLLKIQEPDACIGIPIIEIVSQKK